MSYLQPQQPWPTIFPMTRQAFEYNVQKVQTLKRDRHGNRHASVREVRELAPIPKVVYRKVMQSQHANAHVWDEGGDAWKWWTDIVNGSRNARYCSGRQALITDY